MESGSGVPKTAAAGSSRKGKPESSKVLTMDLQTISKEDICYACIFCKSCTVDEIKYGPLYYRDGVVTHYYCMLFSAALSQFGEDREGILGFLAPDIMKEVRRSYRLKCVYCNVVGASVGCCNKKCRHVFHFPCGLEHGSNFQFFGNYESFCAQHHKPQKISIKQKEWSCPICMAVVSKEQNPVMSSCCKAAVFHKDCMQKMALNAGYFFKCPTCNAGSKFVQEMRSLGVFVPEQDASWEKDNAFHDLYTQYSKCDAEKCECKKGREYIASKGGWMLARCRLCGAAGTHRQCSNLQTVANWACKPCSSVEKKADGEKKKQPKENPKVKAVPPAPKPSTSTTIVTVTDDDNDEDHVSARSGNRCVRNGNRRVKRQVLPVTPPGGEEFDLSKVKISQSCFSYFPYTEEILRDYRKEITLPDWRKLSISVNMTNWILCPVKSDRSQPGPSRSVPIFENSNVTRAKSRNAEKIKSNEASSSKSSVKSNIVRGGLPRRKRGRSRRGCSWSRGELKRSKRSTKRITAPDFSKKEIKATVISDSRVEMKSESAGTPQQLSDEMKEVEVEIIPASAQEKAESLFFSAIEIGGEKLPLQHIPLVRRRKQVFPSDPNRKYFEVNGNILEVNYSASSSDDSKRKFKGTTKYESVGSVSDDTAYIPGSNPALLLAGQVLKMNVEYDVEISYDGEQIRIDESENSCSPSKKFCSSNWKPISKYATNTAATKSDCPTQQNCTLTLPASVPEQNEKAVSPTKLSSLVRGNHVSPKATTLIKPAADVAKPSIPSPPVAALISSSDDDDDDSIIDESGTSAVHKEHTALKPLHEILRRIMTDHTYSGAVVSTIGVKCAGKMKSLQAPPEEWSRSANSWNADMKNRIEKVMNASKSYCVSYNNTPTPTLTLGTMKLKHNLSPVSLKSTERCISPLRSVDINSNLPDQLDQNNQTQSQETEIWEENEIILTD